MPKLSMLKLPISPHHVILALIAGIVLTFCSIAGLDHRFVATENISCGTSCSPHTPAVAIASSQDEIDKDIEPAPPVAIWGGIIVGLSILYLAPSVAIRRHYDVRKVLLTTHLRF